MTTNTGGHYAAVLISLHGEPLPITVDYGRRLMVGYNQTGRNRSRTTDFSGIPGSPAADYGQPADYLTTAWRTDNGALKPTCADAETPLQLPLLCRLPSHLVLPD